MAQDMGNLGQQAKEKIGGAVQQLTDAIKLVTNQEKS